MGWSESLCPSAAGGCIGGGLGSALIDWMADGRDAKGWHDPEANRLARDDEANKPWLDRLSITTGIRSDDKDDVVRTACSVYITTTPATRPSAIIVIINCPRSCSSSSSRIEEADAATGRPARLP